MSDLDQDIERYVAAVLKRIPRASADRERIETDVRTHLQERVDAGQTVGEAIEQMGPAEEVARAYLGEILLPLASFGQRTGAFLIDLLIGAAMVTPALGLAGVLMFGPFWRGDALPIWWIFPSLALVFGISALLFSVFYFPPLEAIYGQTLGKRLLGLYVTTESGEQIGWGAAIVRRLPVFLEFFWFDALFALFTRRRQRAFDMVAKTVVVRHP